MDFLLESFKEKAFCIKTENTEQLNYIRSYYQASEGASTVNEYNIETYPYVFYERGGLHGAGFEGYIDSVVEFSDWLQAAEAEKDYELEESDYDISFLMA